MVKSFVGTIVPGSRKLADEFILPLTLTVVISIVATLVGTVGLGTPAAVAAPATMASSAATTCFASRWPAAQNGFILVGTQGQHERERCRL